MLLLACTPRVVSNHLPACVHVCTFVGLTVCFPLSSPSLQVVTSLPRPFVCMYARVYICIGAGSWLREDIHVCMYACMLLAMKRSTPPRMQNFENFHTQMLWHTVSRCTHTHHRLCMHTHGGFFYVRTNS